MLRSPPPRRLGRAPPAASGLLPLPALAALNRAASAGCQSGRTKAATLLDASAVVRHGTTTKLNGIPSRDFAGGARRAGTFEVKVLRNTVQIVPCQRQGSGSDTSIGGGTARRQHRRMSTPSSRTSVLLGAPPTQAPAVGLAACLCRLQQVARKARGSRLTSSSSAGAAGVRACGVGGADAARRRGAASGRARLLREKSAKNQRAAGGSADAPRG